MAVAIVILTHHSAMVATGRIAETIAMKHAFIAGAALAILGGALVALDAKAQEKREFSGIASYYDKNYSGKTASGQRYDSSKFTAAHRTLPFGTRVVVTDRKTKRSVTVVVNDRGPFIKGRVIDLSYSAAAALNMHHRGLTPVTVAIQ